METTETLVDRVMALAVAEVMRAEHEEIALRHLVMALLRTPALTSRLKVALPAEDALRIALTGARPRPQQSPDGGIIVAFTRGSIPVRKIEESKPVTQALRWLDRTHRGARDTPVAALALLSWTLAHDAGVRDALDAAGVDLQALRARTTKLLAKP